MLDFIFYGLEGFWAIEVKNSKQIYPKDVRSLTAFINDYPEATPLLLYRGTERLKINNILCLPVTDFLINLSPDRYFIPEG